MLRGRPMTVWRRSSSGEDAMGEPIVGWVPETVENVLWGPASSKRLETVTGSAAGRSRPLGTEDTITAYFPKDYTGSLAGCRLEAYGRRWDVLGDPQPYLPEFVRGRWNRTVTARRVDG